MKKRVPFLSPNDSAGSNSSASKDNKKSSSTEQSENTFESGRGLTFPTLGPLAAEAATSSHAVPAPTVPAGFGRELGDETTDNFGAFSACRSNNPCETCQNRPLEVGDGAGAQALLVPTESASWLHTLENYEGYWLVEWGRADSAHPIYLIVGEGKVYYAIARQCRSWIDDVLEHDHPELSEAYKDYCDERQTTSECISMMKLLVDLDQHPLDVRQRKALLDHLARTLAPGTEGRGKRWRLDPEPFENRTFLSFQPIEVLASIGQQMCPVPNLLGQLLALNVEPDQGWLFARGDHGGCEQLIFTSQPQRDRIGQLTELTERADDLLRTSSMTPVDDDALVRALGIDGDQMWMCLADDQTVEITRHPLVHLGRLLRLFEGLDRHHASAAGNLPARTT